MGHSREVESEDQGRVTLIGFKNDGAVIAQFRLSSRMINGAPKRWKTGDECLVPENMIDTKAILFLGRPPSPFFSIAMPFAPQVDEASLPGKGLKKISAKEARAGSLDIEIISARVEVADHDKRHIRTLLCQVDALLKEGCLGPSLWEIAP